MSDDNKQATTMERLKGGIKAVIGFPGAVLSAVDEILEERDRMHTEQARNLAERALATAVVKPEGTKVCIDSFTSKIFTSEDAEDRMYNPAAVVSIRDDTLKAYQNDAEQATAELTTEIKERARNARHAEYLNISNEMPFSTSNAMIEKGNPAKNMALIPAKTR